MGRILMTGGGGDADLDVITAEADDILSGKVIVDKDGNPLTGTLTLSGDAGAGDVLSGKTFYTTNPKSKQTGTMGTMGGGTYTPKAAQQTVSCSGKKMTGNIVIKGDGNLTGNNILYGKSIFGVSGNVRQFASRYGQVTSDSNYYVTLSLGFYIRSWMFMAENGPHDLSTSCPWDPANLSVILPNYILASPIRSGTTFKVKVTTPNKKYNYYVTGYY